MSGRDYMRRWPGLYVREDGAIKPANATDVETAMSYPDFHDKGPVLNGCRVTILTHLRELEVGQQWRIIHVADYVEPGQIAFVMGPKPVCDEYLDGQLVGPACRPNEALAPAEYNGKTLPSPAVDFNYDITSYCFEHAGTHRLQWRPGPYRSNVLQVTVRDTRQ